MSTDKPCSRPSSTTISSFSSFEIPPRNWSARMGQRRAKLDRPAAELLALRPMTPQNGPWLSGEGNRTFFSSSTLYTPWMCRITS